MTLLVMEARGINRHQSPDGALTALVQRYQCEFDAVIPSLESMPRGEDGDATITLYHLNQEVHPSAVEEKLERDGYALACDPVALATAFLSRIATEQRLCAAVTIWRDSHSGPHVMALYPPERRQRARVCVMPHHDVLAPIFWYPVVRL